ncbi:MAG: sugar ABC transporter ATP-binding protein [Caldiserica bacterium]|jgi:ABC-type sugar transport system ATPase subunit|nr:sugar ABC transporter ATP-binding protein [Caldisericota bacterium]MDH7563205.1 sugar ABC transporter ATP-binding protein [Caldisericota bacterium]
MENEIVLETVDLTKVFPGVKALSKMNFSLKAGEVHGVVGLNGSGKTTFLSVIGGLIPRSSGEILIRGQKLKKFNLEIARKYGIVIANQVPAVFPNLKVAENILIGREQTKNYLGFPILDQKRMEEQVRDLLSSCDFQIPLYSKISDLSPSILKQIEIARAMISDFEIIGLDEPTSMMAKSDAYKLFSLIKQLKETKKAVIYVTHRIPEVFELCDRVTIMKNGEKVGTFNTREITPDQVVRLMTGKTTLNFSKNLSSSQGEKVLDLQQVSTKPLKLAETPLREISFSAYKGEVLGIVGVVGAGKTELGKAIVGLNPISSGRINVMGIEAHFGSTMALARKGIVYIPEDMMKEGLFLNLDIRQNISLLALNVMFRNFIQRKKEDNLIKQYISQLNIKPSRPNFPVKNLSGGNKKKTLVARGLALRPNLLILDELTTGVDVESAFDLMMQVRELAKDGVSVVLLSSEFERVLSFLDRVLVMKEGKIVAEFKSPNISEEEVINYATK